MKTIILTTLLALSAIPAHATRHDDYNQEDVTHELAKARDEIEFQRRKLDNDLYEIKRETNNLRTKSESERLAEIYQ